MASHASDGPHATASLSDDSLSVRYNLIMLLSDCSASRAAPRADRGETAGGDSLREAEFPENGREARSAPAWHALRIQTARDLRDNNWRVVIFESPMKNRTIIRFAPLVAPQSLCACGARFDLSSVGSRDARMVCTISTTSSRGTNRISRVSRRSRETYPIELRRGELLDQLA